jgi:hypothetical protein
VIVRLTLVYKDNQNCCQLNYRDHASASQRRDCEIKVDALVAMDAVDLWYIISEGDVTIKPITDMK